MTDALAHVVLLQAAGPEQKLQPVVSGRVSTSTSGHGLAACRYLFGGRGWGSGGNMCCWVLMTTVDMRWRVTWIEGDTARLESTFFVGSLD